MKTGTYLGLFDMILYIPVAQGATKLPEVEFEVRQGEAEVRSREVEVSPREVEHQIHKC